MSIIIQNVSTGALCGLQDYELRINQCVIVRFSHVREDGLATCLRKAAEAVETARNEKITQILLASQHAKEPT